MTDATYYVNTDNSADGDGTTNEVDGSADSAFTTLSAAEAALQSVDIFGGGAGVIGTGNNLIIQCCGTAADTTAVVWAGWSPANESGRVSIVANRAEGDGFYSGNLNYSTAHYRLEVADVCLSMPSSSVEQLTIDGIQVAMTTNAGGSQSCISCDTPTYSTGVNYIENCRVKPCATGFQPRGISLTVGSGSNTQISVIRNNVVHGGRYDGYSIIQTLYGTGANAKGYAWNNSCSGPVSNITMRQASINFNGGGLFYAYNNMLFRGADDHNKQIGGGTNTATWTIDYNAGDDADLHTTNGQDISPGATEADDWPDSLTAPDGGTDAYDYSPVATGVLPNNGTTGDYSPTTDINGVTRHATTPTIGAFEAIPIVGISTFNATPLDASTNYYTHTYQEIAGVASNVLTSSQFTTLAGGTLTNIRQGANTPTAVYQGANTVTKIYQGANLIWG